MGITTPEELVDWRPAADRVRLKERAFWSAVHKQGIPHYRLSKRKILFRLSEIDAWLQSRRVNG